MKNIKDYLRKRKPLLDDCSLMYYGNFLDVLDGTKLCPNFQEAIDNLVSYNGICFFKEDDAIVKIIGKDAKGIRDPEARKLFIRDSLQNPLKEITTYHEIYHATQSGPDDANYCGFFRETNFGRLLMEAQTQYFAEKVYCLRYGANFKEREIPSQELRMREGGTVVSALHNYELYDTFLTKLTIMIDVDKDCFVTANYEYRKGMENLRKKYEEAQKKYRFTLDFNKIMFIMDYVYCTDVVAYFGAEGDRQATLRGDRTKPYSVHGYDQSVLSLDKEFDYIDEFDRKNFVTLIESRNLKKAKEFKRYIVSNATRKMADTILSKIG